MLGTPDQRMLVLTCGIYKFYLFSLQLLLKDPLADPKTRRQIVKHVFEQILALSDRYDTLPQQRSTR